MKQITFTLSNEDEVIALLNDLSKDDYVINASDILALIHIGTCDKVVASTCIALFKQYMPKAKVAGISTSGEIINGEISNFSVSITFMIFRTTKIKILTCDLQSADVYDAGGAVSATLNSTRNLKHIHMLVTSLTLAEKQGKFFRAISLNSPSLRVTGVSAANHWKVPEENDINNVFVFSDKILSMGAIFVLFIGKELVVRASMNLGWNPVGKEHTITSLKNDLVVQTIDDIAAADFYRHYLGITRANNLVKNLLEFPVLVKRSVDTMVARNAVVSFPDGSVMYSADIYEGEKIYLSYGSLETILRTAERDSYEVSAFNPQGLLLNICSLRNSYLASDESTEINCYKNIFPAVSGCMAFGEIYRCGPKIEQLTYALISIALKELSDDSNMTDRAREDFEAHYPASVPTPENISMPMPMDFDDVTVTEDITSSPQVDDFGSIADAFAFTENDSIDLKANGQKKKRTEIYSDDLGKDHNSGMSQYRPLSENSKRKNRENISGIRTTREVMPLSDRMFSLLKATTEEYSKIREREREIQFINRLDIEKKANEVKSFFLSHMSHELRTPINAILGMNEMIIRESHNANILQYAGNIKEAGNALVSIINDVLDYSRIEAGKTVLENQPYSLTALLNDVIIMIRSQADRKGIELKTIIDENIPDKLNGDMPHIRQCLVNLLNNAVKYTPKGHVRLTVSLQECAEEGFVNLSFHVRDTGIGIKPEDKELLFRPFERIEESRNRSIEGSGLGLNITKLLLDLMNSDLSVDSTYGKGSDFYFSLKQKVSDPAPIGNFNQRIKDLSKQTLKRRESFHAPDAVILVVDDNSMNLTVVKKLLQRIEVNVDTAQSGKEAIKRSSNKKYDMIFMDHLMPEMDGKEAMQAIRGDFKNPNQNSPIIVLTANTVSGMKEKFLFEGFDDYLEKPTKPELLEKMVAKYVDSSKITDVDYPDSDEFPAGDPGNPSDTGKDSADSILKKEEISSEVAELLDNIREICGEINVDAGIESCGSVSTYLDVLRQYRQRGKDIYFLIQKAIDENDFNDFRIQVHSLKSSSALAGATILSKEAAKLEDAVTIGNTEKVISDTPDFLKGFKRLLTRLSAIFDSADANSVKNEHKEPISPENFNSALQAIKEFVSVFDFDSADYVIKDLSKYQIPEEDRELFNTLSIYIRNVDHDNAMPLLEGRI